jgi:hypothetical protein
VPLFERCSKRELEDIAGLADELDVAQGRTLTSEGKTGYEFLVLVDGAASVKRKGRTVNTLVPATSSARSHSSPARREPRPSRRRRRHACSSSRRATSAASCVIRRRCQMKVLEALAARLPDEGA